MGVTVKDYVPLYGEKVGVKFSPLLPGADAECALWADVLQPSSATVMASYTSGRYPGEPAITINSFGQGKAVYVGADLEPVSLARVLSILLSTAGVTPSLTLPRGVEHTVRQSGDKRWVFLLNHTPAPQTITLPSQHKDALTGATRTGKVTLAPYDVLVLAS
jgi:beta-galactosidase